MRMVRKAFRLAFPRRIMPVALLALAACSGGDGKDEEKAPAPETVRPEIVPALPVEVKPLGRQQILSALAASADAAASGSAPPSANAELVGRSFEIRLPFGCEGPDTDDWANWRFDAAARSLKLTAASEQWTGTPLARTILPEKDYEALEGFWLNRPWTTSEACPQAPASNTDVPEAEVPLPRETAGIAQFFSTDSPRTLQRAGRPYSMSLKRKEPPSAGQSFRLVLQGRIGAFPDGQPVRCNIERTSLPPVCIIAAKFSRVAFEDALTGESLADWKY